MTATTAILENNFSRNQGLFGVHLMLPKLTGTGKVSNHISFLPICFSAFYFTVSAVAFSPATTCSC